MTDRETLRNDLLKQFTDNIMRHDAKTLRHTCHALAASLSAGMTKQELEAWYKIVMRDAEKPEEGK